MIDSFTAVKLKDAEALKNCLGEEDLTALDKFGCTLLYWAAKSGDLATTGYLLQQGANTALANTDGTIPVQAASNVKMVELLLQHGSPVNVRNSIGDTLLYDAIDSNNDETALLLLEKGADPSFPNSDGKLPIHAAITADNSNMLSALLEKGSDCNLPDREGYTPFLIASEFGSTGCLQVLANCADIFAVSPEGDNALHLAVVNDSVETLQFLLELQIPFWGKNLKGQTPLDLALDKKFNLRHAAQILKQYAETRLFATCREGDYELTEKILAAGTDPNSREDDGSTPLIAAAMAGHIKPIRLLLARGAAPYNKNKSGKSALDLALNEEVKKLLS